MTHRLAPSFDHSSSLGRDLTDGIRNDRMRSPGGVIDYILRGEGQTFVDGLRKKGPSPLLLAQVICLSNPDLARPVLTRLASVPDRDLRAAINKVPADLMSQPAKKFACQMVLTGKAALLRGFR